MAHHFELDREHKILLMVLEGNVEGDEFLGLNLELRTLAARFHPLAGITDCAPIENFNVSSNTLRTAALQESPYPSTTARYIVAPSDYLFGLARMYELVGNAEGNLQVVRKLEEALADLGVNGAKFERVSD